MPVTFAVLEIQLSFTTFKALDCEKQISVAGCDDN